MARGHREEGGLIWSVERICDVLRCEYGVSVSRSGYYAYKSRKPSARSIRDEYYKEKIVAEYYENYSCYGVRKMWRELRKQGNCDLARCTVERLMKELDLKGSKRGKVKRTTVAADGATCAADLVNRVFYADEPNRIWVADFTYVSTWEGWCYSAFIVDVFARRIIGWCVSTRMNRTLVANAFALAVFARKQHGLSDLSELIHHNDKGSQYTADDFVELLALHGVQTSIGSVGDSYDNALAETINGTYKTELIGKFGPWKTFEELQYETARWVKWYNEKRINEYCDYQTPQEVEQVWYATGIDSRKGVEGVA